MKNIIKKILSNIISFILKNEELRFKFIRLLLRSLNEKNAEFVTYHVRKQNIKVKKSKEKKELAIIVQGPILKKKNFTVNTILKYLSDNINSKIILSTWEGQLAKADKIKLIKLGVVVIENKLPYETGPLNINYQIFSTNKAIEYAEKLKIDFLIKTRTDTRLNMKNFDLFLYNMVNIFKKKNNKYRIGTTSFTRQFRLFGISEIILYGKTRDLKEYFNVKINNKSKINFEKLLKKSIKSKESIKLLEPYRFSPESFLFFNYLYKNLKKKIIINYKNHIKYIMENILIVDNSSLDFYWFKYNSEQEYRDRELFSSKSKYEYFNFSKWLFFYCNNKN